MPRNGAGVYTLPAGNPVVTLTTISSTWANTTMADIATALTGSLAINGVTPMSGPLQLVDGSAAAPGLAWATEGTSGWYRSAIHVFNFSVNTVPIVSIAATGVTLTPPGATPGLIIVGSTGNVASIQLKDGQTGTRQWSLAAGVTAIGSFDIVDNTAAKTRVSINTTGNVSFLASDSGIPVTIQGLVATPSVLSLVGGVTQGAGLLLSDNVSTLQQWTIGSGLSLGAGVLELRDSTRGVTTLAINKTGNIGITASTTGITLSVAGNTTLTGAANARALTIQASTTAGQSLGININAGTNSADQVIVIRNAVSSAQYLLMTGDGLLAINQNVSIGTVTAGTALTVSGAAANIGLQINTPSDSQLVLNAGAGGQFTTLSFSNNNTVKAQLFYDNSGGVLSLTSASPFNIAGAGGLLIGGSQIFSGIPRNVENTNYQFVLADQNKLIYHSGGANTYTIPANSGTAFPQGTTINIMNLGTAITLSITTDTLLWLPSGASGSRTLATNSLATLYKIDATTWSITGVGIS